MPSQPESSPLHTHPGDLLAAAVLDGLGDTILILHRDGRVRYANDLAATRFHADRQALLGQGILSFWPALGAAGLEKHLRELPDGRGDAVEFAVHQPAPAGADPGESSGRWDAVKLHPLGDGGVLLVAWDITARRRAEEALRVSEARYRSLVHSTTGIVWVAGPDGKIEGEYPPWEALTGQRPEQARGWGWLEAIHPEDRPGLETTWRRALTTREPIEVEFRVFGPYGETHHLSARGAPIFADDLSGTVREWVGTCRDVTTIRRGEADREEHERHDRLLAEVGTLLAGSLGYHTMLQNVAELAVRELADFCFFDVLDFDGDGGLRRVAWAHRDPTQSARFADTVHFVPPPDQRNHPIRRVLRTGRPVFMPRMGNKDRREVTLNPAHEDYLARLDPTASIFVPVSARGELFGVLTLARLGGRVFSAVELRLAEELGERAGLALDHARLHDALRASEARFRSVTAAIPQMVWTSAPDGAIDFVNDRWLDFHHRTAEQSATVEHWREMIHPDDFDAALAAWDHSLRSGEPLEIESRLRRAEDNAWRWHLSRAVPLRGTAGGGKTILKWFGTATDIHALREAEVARREADQGRADDLAEADRRKDEFLAMLSHELRNPLAAAGNAVALLRADVSAADRAWATGVIERQVGHLARLIDDLLDVSRITRDKVRLRKTHVTPAVIAREAVECVRALLDERRHALELVFPEDLPTLEADPTRLEQIFVNLLTNAARYTPPGGRIVFSAHGRGEAATAEPMLTFQVRDNGPGIPADQLERIFDLFAQGDRSLARSEGGLGIGLTVAKRLAELHGGSVTVASDGPGQGSVFTVQLPIGDTAKSLLPPPAPASPASPDTVARARTRVLVVDDNADTVASMIRLLRMRGFEPLAAARGQEALDLARTEHPAVILLDIGLPDLDGYEVAARLRQEERAEAAKGRPRATLIAVSGYGQEEDRRRSRDAGFDHHLVKPVDFGSLVSLVAGAKSQ